jgi:hypothetical protein
MTQQRWGADVAGDNMVQTNYGAGYQLPQAGPYGPASTQYPQEPQAPGFPQFMSGLSSYNPSYQNPQISAGLGMGVQPNTPGQLPLSAILAAMQPAAPRVTQLPQPTNWLGPGTGGGEGMGSLFGNVATAGGADPGNMQQQLALLSRLLGLGPSMMSGQGMNAFGGMGMGGRLNTVQSPLWGVGGAGKRWEP